MHEIKKASKKACKESKKLESNSSRGMDLGIEKRDYKNKNLKRKYMKITTPKTNLLSSLISLCSQVQVRYL